jgi:UDP-N-acetylmuramoyl-L-alanyl-D-glutamate--2,6-diaminopimelate ligase
VLTTIADVLGNNGSITTVTGAGGNRDHGKRPQMGAEAARRSQRVIITSDNPRDENPEDIADDIKAGIPVDTEAQVDIILERAAAIHVAITEANPGDVVLVAGKGHEDYQEFENHRRIHFDDREQVRNALAARANK